MVHDGGVGDVVFSPDGKTLLTRCWDSSHTSDAAQLWDVASGQPIGPPRLYSQEVRAIAFRPDGSAVAAAIGSSFRGSEAAVSIWPVPAPASGAVGRLRLMSQVWTGMELRDNVVYRLLGPEDWLQRKRQLDSMDKGP
jgi:WD40 repeat protein